MHLPPAYAQRLFDARDAGASDRQMHGIIAEEFKDVYFQDGGGRAMEQTGMRYLGAAHPKRTAKLPR